MMVLDAQSAPSVTGPPAVDGIGPAQSLAAAGSPLALGSDQHAVVDPLVEARALEYGARVRSGRRCKPRSG